MCGTRCVRSRIGGVLACAALWTAPATGTATTIPRIALTVRVYQKAGLPPALEQRALTEAETVLRAGLVDVRWHDCAGPKPTSACSVPPGPSEVLLVVRAGLPCQDTAATLGKAVIVPRGRGVLATVDVSCVSWLATAARTDVAVLLGRVVAHELGHLMMRTSTHTRRGLMRAYWTPQEVRRNQAADWAFTAEDVGAMRELRPGHSTDP
jgi:hypothetical protein